MILEENEICLKSTECPLGNAKYRCMGILPNRPFKFKCTLYKERNKQCQKTKSPILKEIS